MILLEKEEGFNLKEELNMLLSNKINMLKNLDTTNFGDADSYKVGQYDLIDEIITFLHEFEEK